MTLSYYSNKTDVLWKYLQIKLNIFLFLDYLKY